ncbi:MAG: M23 family metallopeptidase [Magnetococcus sp. YQC-5]
MQALYPTSASIRNHPFQTVSTSAMADAKNFWTGISLRFFTMLVPALLGSFGVSIWLGTPSSVAPIRTEPVPVAQKQAVHEMATRILAIGIPSHKQDLLPSLEALDGLFAASHGSSQQELESLHDAVEPRTKKGMTPLETQINQLLLDNMDPLLLSRNQKQIFISSIPTGYPVVNMGVNSPFGYRIHPTLHTTRFHPGVDLQATMNTQVMATADGVVEFAGVDNNKFGLSGFGQVVALHHNFGFRTTYSHLNKILVHSGDFVKKGDIIGLSGQSGIATAPHLHYEIRFIKHYLNPTPFMQWTQEQYDRLFQEKTVKWHSLIELIGLRLPSRPTVGSLYMVQN